MTRVRWAALLAGIALLAVVAGFALHDLWLDDGKRQAPATAFKDTLAKASFPDLAGQPHRFDQWRGKVLVVNFWATWCPPCLKEIPEFIRMQARYRERGLQFVGVAIDQPEKVAPFADRMGFNYPVLVGALDAVELVRALGNQHGGLPFTVVFDRSGTLVAAELGGLDEAKLSRVVDPLL
jgi:thiol-disulfide isomerase/thioredoxin